MCINKMASVIRDIREHGAPVRRADILLYVSALLVPAYPFYPSIMKALTTLVPGFVFLAIF